MASTLPIARVGGVDIRAHWSLLVVVALLVWSLTDGVFPETNSGLSDGGYLAMALVAAFLFLLSILLHELGHAVQARREGVPVGGITLWVFGGIAEMSGDMPSPGAGVSGSRRRDPWCRSCWASSASGSRSRCLSRQRSTACSSGAGRSTCRCWSST